MQPGSGGPLGLAKLDRAGAADAVADPAL